MDAATAMTEWTMRRAASVKAEDPAEKERLRVESEKCKERMLAARREGGS